MPGNKAPANNLGASFRSVAIANKTYTLYYVRMIDDCANLEAAMTDMYATARLAAQLAMKDSDLPKDDIVGEIDAGATESLLRMAVLQARAAIECAGEGAFVGAMARWVPMRQVAGLLRSDEFVMNHHRGGLLNDLLTAAMHVARNGETALTMQHFNDLNRMAGRVFLQPPSAALGDNESDRSLGETRCCP